jgi:NDP-sugar pyrophosphorylase family protein
MTPRNLLVDTAGIVLVGTHPWTNSSFDRLVSRPLLPVANRPLMWYALAWLRDGGVHDVSVCANRETQILESRLHRHVPAGIHVSYHEDAMPRGAAGAVRDAVAANDAEVFVVADGTAIPNVSISDLLRAHRASQSAATVVVHAEPSGSGQSIQVPTGIYVFNRAILDFVPATGFFDIKETLIPMLHRAGIRVTPYSVASASPRVLDASTYLAVNEWMVEHLAATPGEPDGYIKASGCLFHRDAMIAPGASFIGPVLVGPGAQVAAGAVVVGPTSIGRDAIVEPGALISRSAVWRRCVIQNNAVIDRCIVGDDAEVASGTQAFWQIRMAAVARDEVARRRQPQDAQTRELLKRVSRAFLGTAWSRTPAAQ